MYARKTHIREGCAQTKFAYLAHELLNDAVERGALVAEALFSSAESAEVLSSLGDNIRSELHNDATSGLTTDGHVKVTAWEGHGYLKISSIRCKVVMIKYSKLYRDQHSSFYVL